MRRIVIAGSRDIDDPERVKDIIFWYMDHVWMEPGQDSYPGEFFDAADHVTLISGGARGVDTCAREFAEEYGLPFEEYPADWDKYKKAAGFIRNEQMADTGDCLLAIWDGVSNGTRNMIDHMLRRGKEVVVRVLP